MENEGESLRDTTILHSTFSILHSFLLARFPDYHPAPRRAALTASASRDVRIIAKFQWRRGINV